MQLIIQILVQIASIIFLMKYKKNCQFQFKNQINTNLNI